MRLKTPARALNRNRKTIAKHYHCRDNDAEIRMPKERQIGHATPVRAIAFGGQGTARPTCAAWRCRGGCINRLNFVGRLCQTPAIRARRFRTEPRGRKRPGRAGRRLSERGPTSQNALQFISALRRYAIGERVRVKIGVITQTVPGTILFVRLRDAVFFTRGKVIPRIVPGDREERPVGALQVLHQYVAGSRVVCRAWQFA